MDKTSLRKAYDAFLAEKNQGTISGEITQLTHDQIDSIRDILQEDAKVSLMCSLAKGRHLDEFSIILGAIQVSGFSMFEFGRYIAQLERDEKELPHASS